MRPVLSTAAALAVALALMMTALLAAPAQAQDSAPYFKVDTLNPGLSEPPGYLDRSTPQGTVESLFDAARRGDWSVAAHLLDLSDISPDMQGLLGADLARKLETVITRKTVVDWGSLLDRPDGVDASASDRAPLAGEPRKSILLWVVNLADRPVSIRLNRIAPQQGQGDPVWVFSRQTVRNIDALFARYGPSWLERELPPGLREKSLGGLMVWELIGLPILLLTALGVGIAFWRVLDRIALKRTGLMGDVARAVRGPVAFGSVTVLLSWATSTLFVFSGRIEALLSPAVAFGIIVSALWLMVNAIDAVLDRLVVLDSNDLSKRQLMSQRALATKVAAGRRALIVVAVLVCAGMVLSSSNLFTNLGFSLLGVAGALTLVLGFAARRVLGNIMSSLQIALNQSARIGDRIVYDDELCHVERINFTFVQLRNWDGTRLVVPVEEFASRTFSNWTMMEPEMLRVIKLNMAHDADVEALREIFDEVIETLDQDELGNLDDRKVRVASQDVFGKEVWFSLPCADPNTSWDLACTARERIIDRAAKRGEQADTSYFPDATPAEAA